MSEKDRTQQQIINNAIRIFSALGSNRFIDTIEEERAAEYRQFIKESDEQEGYVVALPILNGGYVWILRKFSNEVPQNPIETFTASDDSLNRYLPPEPFNKYPIWFLDKKQIY